MPQDRHPETERKYVDLDKVIASKSKRLSRLMPWFIKSYLKRVIHQDDLNSFLSAYGHLEGLDFVAASVNFFQLEISATGLEHLSPKGRQLVVSNHPLGGLDGIALMHTVAQINKDIIFPVNDILLFLPNIHGIFIPINKHGKNTKNIRRFDEAFASDATILYFPAGLVSRKKKGQIRDLEWKKTFIQKAVQHKRNIIPTHIGGRNSNFFYTLANLRSMLGINSNIEMLFLVDEMYKQTRKTIPITFGEEIPYTVFDRKKKKDREWAAWVKEKTYATGSKSTPAK